LKVDWDEIKKKSDELAEKSLSKEDSEKFEEEMLAWLRRQRKG